MDKYESNKIYFDVDFDTRSITFNRVCNLDGFLPSILLSYLPLLQNNSFEFCRFRYPDVTLTLQRYNFGRYPFSIIFDYNHHK